MDKIKDCVIDPFEDHADPYMIHYVDSLAERFAPTTYTEAPRELNYDEACIYIDGLPSFGLISENAKHIPVGAWAAMSVATHAAYTIAAHTKLMPDPYDSIYLKKVAELLSENPETDYNKRAIEDGDLHEIAIQRSVIDGVAQSKAIEAGEDFEILCDAERSVLTGCHPRCAMVASREFSVENPTKSEYHAKLFEHAFLNEYVKGRLAVGDCVRAIMEREAMLASRDEYLAGLHDADRIGGVFDGEEAAVTSYFFDDMILCGGEKTSIPSREDVYAMQSEFEDSVFGKLKEQMDRGYRPSDEFWSVVEYDEFKGWYEKEWLKMSRAAEIEKTTELSCEQMQLEV